MSHYSVGDVFNLPSREAELLLAENWAVLLSEAAPHSCTPTAEELRCIREQLKHWSEQQSRRRVEDRIREALHDTRAVTVRVEWKKKPDARRARDRAIAKLPG